MKLGIGWDYIALGRENILTKYIPKKLTGDKFMITMRDCFTYEFLGNIMSKLIKLAAFISVMLLVVEANAATIVGDPVAGKDKSALCQGCHGEEGISAAPAFPHLAGQYAGYIRKQIADFQARSRKDDTMEGMADTVAEKQDLADIAAYFASQKPMRSGSPVVSPLGEDVYLNGNSLSDLYGCVNCHGDKGKGKSPNNSVFPVIGGQHKEYLIKQLNEFRNGVRSNDPAGMMGDIAEKMTDAEIEAVSEYLAGL